MSCVWRRGRDLPAVRQTQDIDDLLADETVDAVAVVTRCQRITTWRSRAQRRQARIRRETAGFLVGSRRRFFASATAASVLMPGHTFLYSPPVNRIRGTDPRWGLRGHLFHLHVPRQSRSAPVGCERDLGSRSPRFLDPPVLARRTPPPGHQHGPRLHRHKEDVAFITCEFDSGTIADVELSWLAPSKLRRTTVGGVEEDGRVRRLQHRAGARIRRWRGASRSRVVPSTSSIGRATSCLLTSRAASRLRFKSTTSVAQSGPVRRPPRQRN